jgi:hypothetical protein
MMAGSAQAGWLMTHGSATQLGDNDSTLEYCRRNGEGLTVVIKTNNYASFTLAMPAPGEANMQLTKVKLSFWTGFSVAINQVKIYDGSELIAEVSGNWWGPKTLYVKIPPRVMKSGMVMYIEGHASYTPDGLYRMVVIKNAGGLFLPAPL